MRFFNLFTRKKKQKTKPVQEEASVILEKQAEQTAQQTQATQATQQIPPTEHTEPKTAEHKSETVPAQEQTNKDIPLADFPQLKEGQESKPIKKEPKSLLIFDKKEEETLLQALEAHKGNYIQLHLLYTQLAHFYYKYRDLDEKYLNLCITYCLHDIQHLDSLKTQYIAEQIAQLKPTRKGAKKTKEERIKEIQDKGYDQEIACFKRLAIIYEKQGDFDRAIDVCEQAIAFPYNVAAYQTRKAKLLKKKASR